MLRLQSTAAALLLLASLAGCEPSPPAYQPPPAVAAPAAPPGAPLIAPAPAPVPQAAPAPPLAPAPAPTPAPQAAPTPARRPAPALPRIEVRLDREWVERLREGDGRIWGSATIRPSTDKAGRPIGLTLTDMRPDGLYGSAGLQEGDTVRAVNGMPLTSEVQALEAYSRLRHAARVELLVVRGGAPLVIVVVLAN